tara:strand:- start:2696 stop:2896 length:201 start_codon:yes stop_codon:yes gene_type:complete
MKVEIKFTSDSEDDGFEGSTTVVRGNIVDLYGLGQAYADATRAGGYTYVEDVAFEKDDGQMVFGGF